MKQILTLFATFFIFNLFATPANEKAAHFSQIASKGFEKNLGQVEGKDRSAVNYFYKSGPLTIFLTKKGLAYQFEKWETNETETSKNRKLKRETYRMDVELIGANPNAEIIEEDKLSSFTNYYNYNILNVGSFRKITYKNIYENIDWVIYLTPALSKGEGEYLSPNHSKGEGEYLSPNHSKGEGALKYDFVVHPGGNPDLIKLKVKWAEDVKLDVNGSLNLINSLGNIVEAKPISYQGDLTVETNFKLNGNILSFQLENYNKNQLLVIDPILQWATYYGGSLAETGGYTTIDGSGNVYLCGATASTTTIASGGHQTTMGGINDAFLVKFNSSGIRQWASYYGGSDDDRGTYCHIDKNNNVYLAGLTMSTSSIASGGHQNTHGGDFDAFVVKFNPSGTRQWATYYGGGNIEEHVTCATDTGLNVYLSGTTQSNNNIFATGGFQNTFGGFSDAFLVKFNASGARQWGTFYGGVLRDELGQCAVDKNGSVYIGGTTLSTTNISGTGFQNTKNPARDAFLIKFNPNGTRAWGTYYGGAQDDYGNSVCVDTLLNVYLSGFTYSTSNISSGGFQNTFGGINDAYLVKFNTSGGRIWGTYYGGSNGDYGPHCITDKYNNVYLTGYTLSTNAIGAAGLFNTSKGNIEGYIVKFNPSGTRFWGSYYGGTNDEYLLSSAPDGFGNVYYSGQTLSNAQISSGGHQNTYGGAGDVFLVKMSEDPIPYIEIFSSKGDTFCQGDSVIFTKSDVNAGTNPKYRWFRNNTLVDTTASYKGVGFAAGDSVKCLLISNAVGLLYDSAWSLTIKIFVHPKKFSTINASICKPFSYFFKGQPRSSTGAYLDTLLSAKGCDSIITLNLTVKDTSSFTFFDTICSNQSYFFNGAPRTTAGIYKDTLVNANICDSFLYLNLFIKSTTSKIIDSSICSRNPYFFNGFWRTATGTYLDTLLNAKGCDSFITLNLTVKPNSSKTIDTAICFGKSYWFKGQNRTTTGTYRDTLANSLGCDSFVILNLTIKALSSTILNASICDNQSYVFKSIPRTTTGIYRDTLTNAVGCDSFITLILTVNARSYKTVFDTICSNKTYLFDGNPLNMTGTYYDTLQNSKNCDSIITLNLYVKSTSNQVINQTICSNSSYFFNGMPRTTAGIYIDTLTNTNGCDSFLTLNLFVNTISTHSFTKEICLGDSFLFNGGYKKLNGIYLDTLINQVNCDSFLTLNLIVRSPSSFSFPITRCQNNPYFFNGSFRTSSGNYMDTLINQYGCDSFITLNYTLNNTSSFAYTVSICLGETYTFDGNQLTAGGNYVLTTTNSVGCDSTVTLTLIVRPSYLKIIDTSVCVGKTVFFKGNFYSLPNTYYDSLKSIYNCDSIIVLNLKNLPISQNIIYRKFCKNGGVLFNNKYITIEGEYYDTLNSSKGCDSFITLKLVQDTSHMKMVQRSICSYDSFRFGGKFLKEGGTYLDTFKNTAGCDSAVTLNLTVHMPKKITVSKYSAGVLTSEQGFISYQWFLNKIFLAKEKRFYIEVSSKGTYSLAGIDSNSCYSVSNEFYFEGSHISNSIANEYSIYPIPANDKLYISCPAHLVNDKTTISVYRTDGMKALHIENQNKLSYFEIDTRLLSIGIYILEINAKEGNYKQKISILR